MDIGCFTKVKFNGPDESIVKKIKAKEKDIVLKDRILLSYISDGKTHSVKSPITGVVGNANVKLGDLLNHNQLIFEIFPGCPHTTLLKDICAICGQEVIKEEKFSNISSYIPLVHKIPELKVDKEHAIIMGKADEKRLIKERRLILIVDLDQTLIHTTNEEIPADIDEVHHYQLPNSYPNWYHTKCRPHTAEFLTNLSKYFELHICTFGARAYAHMIANIIDNNGKLFSHRILSRDEFIDPYSKTANLKTLFPFGDSLVCIIDDREDVWNFVPNVVHVKPYKYFNCTDDINLPPGFLLDKNFKTMDTKETLQCDTKVDNSENIKLDTEQDVIDISDSLDSDIKTSHMPHDEWKDKDDYLYYLEDILVNIHHQYYELFDKQVAHDALLHKETPSSEIPTLRTIIPEIRSKVLMGVNIVFSGVFPKHVALENSKERKIAISLGAIVSTDIQPNVTTHLIAAIKGTNKIHRAKKLGIHIVTIDWLISCYERWEHTSEKLFPLNETVDTLIETKNGGKLAHAVWKIFPFEHKKSFKIHHHTMPEHDTNIDNAINFYNKSQILHENTTPTTYYDKVTGKKITKIQSESKSDNPNDKIKSSFTTTKTTFDRIQSIEPLSKDLIKNMEQEIFEALNESDDDDEDNESNASLSDTGMWFSEKTSNQNEISGEGLIQKQYKRKRW